MKLSKSLVFSSAVLIVNQSALAVDWTGAVNNIFNEDGNWGAGAPGSAPGSTEVARFTQDAATTFNSSTTIGSLVVRTLSGPNVISLDTGGSTLSFSGAQAINVQGIGADVLALTGNFSFTRSGVQNVLIKSGSSVVFDDSELFGSGSRLVFSGLGDASLTDTNIDSNFSAIVVNLLDLSISGDVGVESQVRLINGGGLSFDSSSDQLTVDSIVGYENGASWVFDLDDLDNDPGQGASNHSFIVADALDLTFVDLDASNVPAYAAGPGHVVLATYNDSLLGTFSADNLGPGLFIDYAFGPSGNQIAIVPEASLVAPIFAGFLPFFIFRRRSRR